MEPTPPARHHHPLRARLAAIAALTLLVLAALAFLLVAINVLDGLIVLGCLFLGTYCAWLALTRPGRLLLSEAVQRAEPPHEIDGVNPDDLPVRE